MRTILTGLTRFCLNPDGKICSAFLLPKKPGQIYGDLHGSGWPPKATLFVLVGLGKNCPLVAAPRESPNWLMRVSERGMFSFTSVSEV
jgi:hypothetical protein